MFARGARGVAPRLVDQSVVDALEAAKQAAVAREDYREAARLKDELTHLLTTTSGSSKAAAAAAASDDGGAGCSAGAGVSASSAPWQEEVVAACFQLDAAGARDVYPGCRALPPLCEAPCRLPGAPLLTALVKPPDADSLWQWYVGRRSGDGGCLCLCVRAWRSG